jgi:large subunit ribosomal protein L4e
MFQIRPNVSVYGTDAKPTGTTIKMPAVYRAPIRNDLVNFIHNEMRRNSMQGRGVSKVAGVQVSAESWGTGRAVARIPRVRGGGTHRSGQAAYGNFCRGGHMFAPLKTWRKFHRRINIKQKRYALCSAIAASGIPALSLARGHAIEEVPEFPLVVSDSVEEVKKTKQAVEVLKSLKAWNDIKKVKASERWRAGIGKMRNRRNIRKRGPIIIYKNDNGITRAFRNIPGITLIPVQRLNLLKLAPGGHLGRFAIWTESAFKSLDALYGSTTRVSTEKKDFHLPRSIMKNTDVTAILNHPSVKKVLRPRQTDKKAPKVRKNPLKNMQIMHKLNPHAIVKKRRNIRNAIKVIRARDAKKAGKPVPTKAPVKGVKKAPLKGKAKK